MDVHVASDLLAFAYGSFTEASKEAEDPLKANEENSSGTQKRIIASSKPKETKRVATIVCPSRELSYALFSANQAGVDIALADFGLYGTSDGWRGVDRWIDLSTSETIWR